MKYLALILSLLFATKSFSQTTDSTGTIKQETELENQSTDNSSDADIESQIDLSQNLLHQKINLNNCTTEDLQLLVENNLITEVQLQSFFSYRNTFGKLISIFELQTIPNWDLQTIYSVLPFVLVNTSATDYHVSTKEILFKGNYQFMLRDQQVLETPVGFSLPDSNGTARYLGSKQNVYMRFKYSYGNRISYGITGQKDAGEEFFKGTQPYGFDFYSAHLYFKTNSFLKAVSLGDYEIKFGQGLIAWSGFGSSKSAEVLLIEKTGRTLKPYTSTNEYNFFRGAAAVIGNHHFDITLFGSQKKVDANVNSIDTISDEITVTSFGGNGYHRTPSELENKNVIQQTVEGGNINYHVKQFSIGLSVIHTMFNASLIKTIYPYNQFDFNSNHLTDMSADAKWNLKNASLFSEYAMSDNHGKAFLAGALVSLDSHVDLSFVIRDYQKNFQSLFANAFAESSTPQNEKGFYTGLSIQPNSKFTIHAYSDFYQKPWLDYQIDAPSSFGTDYLLQIDYHPSKTLDVYTRFKTETHQENLPNNISVSDYLATINKKSLRLNFSYKVNPSFTVRSRAEWSNYNYNFTKEGGFLFYQDAGFNPMNSPLSFSARYYLFDIDGYDARIYVYENDVLYAYSIPTFQNRGSRFYLLMQYHINRHFDFWIRFDETYYQNTNIISSGTDQINAPHKSELKTQLRYSF